MKKAVKKFNKSEKARNVYSFEFNFIFCILFVVLFFSSIFSSSYNYVHLKAQLEFVCVIVLMCNC